MTELLIFLDYLGEIKGAFNGRDEIRKALYIDAGRNTFSLYDPSQSLPRQLD